MKSNMATGATSLAGRKSEGRIMAGNGFNAKGKIVEDFWYRLLPDLGKDHSDEICRLSNPKGRKTIR
jgi:alanine-alpha-ketoisovalerate/valine-pyruvate aminotransferase